MLDSTNEIANALGNEPCHKCVSLKQEFDAQKKLSTENFLLLKERIINTDDLVRRYQAKLVESANRMQQIQELRKQNDALKLKAESAEEQLTRFLRHKDDVEKTKADHDNRVKDLGSRIDELLHQIDMERATINLLKQQLDGKNELMKTAASHDAKMKEIDGRMKKIGSERDEAIIKAEDNKRAVNILKEMLKKYEQVLRSNNLSQEVQPIPEFLTTGASSYTYNADRNVLSSMDEESGDSSRMFTRSRAQTAVSSEGADTSKRKVSKAAEKKAAAAAKKESPKTPERKSKTGFGKVGKKTLTTPSKEKTYGTTGKTSSVLGLENYDEDSSSDEGEVAAKKAQTTADRNAFISDDDDEDSSKLPEIPNLKRRSSPLSHGPSKRSRPERLPSIDHLEDVPSLGLDTGTEALDLLLQDVSHPDIFADFASDAFMTSTQREKPSTSTVVPSTARATRSTAAAPSSVSSSSIAQTTSTRTASSRTPLSKKPEVSSAKPLNRPESLFATKEPSTRTQPTASRHSELSSAGLFGISDDSSDDESPPSVSQKTTTKLLSSTPPKQLAMALPTLISPLRDMVSPIESVLPDISDESMESISMSPRRPEPKHRFGSSNVARTPKPPEVAASPATPSTSAAPASEQPKDIPSSQRQLPPVAASKAPEKPSAGTRSASVVAAKQPVVPEKQLTPAQAKQSATPVVPASQPEKQADDGVAPSVPDASGSKAVGATRRPEPKHRSSALNILRKNKPVAPKTVEPPPAVPESSMLETTVSTQPVAIETTTVEAVVSAIVTSAQSEQGTEVQFTSTAEVITTVSEVSMPSDEAPTVMSETLSETVMALMDIVVDSQSETLNLAETVVEPVVEKKKNETESENSQPLPLAEPPAPITDVDTSSFVVEMAPVASSASVALDSRTVSVAPVIEVAPIPDVVETAPVAPVVDEAADMATEARVEKVTELDITVSETAAAIDTQSEASDLFSSPRKLCIADSSPAHDEEEEEESSPPMQIDEPPEIEQPMAEEQQPIEKEKAPEELVDQEPKRLEVVEAADEVDSLASSPGGLAIVFDEDDDEEEQGQGAEKEKESPEKSPPEEGELEEGEVEEAETDAEPASLVIDDEIVPQVSSDSEDEEDKQQGQQKSPSTSPNKSVAVVASPARAMPSATDILQMHSLGILSPPKEVLPKRTTRQGRRQQQQQKVGIGRRLSMEEIFASVDFVNVIVPPPSFLTEEDSTGAQQQQPSTFKKPQPVPAAAVTKLSPPKPIPALQRVATAKPGPSSTIGIVRTRGRSSIYSGPSSSTSSGGSSSSQSKPSSSD